MSSYQRSNPTEPDDPTDPLVIEYAPLVRHVVGKVAPRGIVGVDREDLISAGVLGLVISNWTAPRMRESLVRPSVLAFSSLAALTLLYRSL